MGRHSTESPCAGAGRPLPLSGFSWFWRQSRLPDPQKKKKKKWSEVDQCLKQPDMRKPPPCTSEVEGCRLKLRSAPPLPWVRPDLGPQKDQREVPGWG